MWWSAANRWAMMERIASDFVPPTSSEPAVLQGLRFIEPPAPEPQAAVAAPPAPPAPPAGPPAEAAGAAEPVVDDLTVLRSFAEVAPGLVMPTSRAQWQALPELMRIQLSAAPGLADWAESFANIDELPARLALAMRSGEGLDALNADDLAVLERAGFGATVARVHAARREAVWAQFEQGQAAAAAARPSIEQIQAQQEEARKQSFAANQLKTQREAMQRIYAGGGQ
jgi:hypothetical protein